ncbi:MAG: beta-CASP ribonuclease aCPSF1 [Candidatus Heimdallarchaeota archaeon]|nr:beta-CASP ribonuclease aCPSF1 [Candidatus Heimdallarchaeota archaeon]
MVPANARITSIEFEGSEVAIYSKDLDVLFDVDGLVSKIARTIRKRVVIRSDPSIRLPEDEVRAIIATELEGKVEVGHIDFDESLGEVIIHVDKPNKISARTSDTLKELTRKTKWRPNILRIPPLESSIIRSVRNVFATDTKARKEALRKIGTMVHRESLLDRPIIRITALGGYLEVGRSSTLLQTGDSNILIDCGVSVGSAKPSQMLPRFDLPEFEISNLDAVVVSHAHLDHCGFVPFLIKYGYEGPIYTTAPTRDLMTMLQIDYLDIAEKEGKLKPYTKNDIRKTTLQTITIGWGEVTDIAPGIKLTLHNAGHILGSSIIHLHIGNGKYNIAFAHDFKFANTRLLDRAVHKFPRLETIIMEGTYGNPKDITPSRQHSEKELSQIILKTIEAGGKVLMPVLAVGRAQELQLVIENLMRTKRIPEVPVYVEGMIKEATAVTTNHPEFLSRQLRDLIFAKDVNPFLSAIFNPISSQEERERVIFGDPCIIMATSGMLVGGPSVHYFNGLAEDAKNSVIFVSYQGKGTLGRKVAEGADNVTLKNSQGKTIAISINLSVHQLSGFTGHSDRRELMEFAKRLYPRPKQYVIVHGEASKCVTLAKSISRNVKREAIAPPIGSTTRLEY